MNDGKQFEWKGASGGDGFALSEARIPGVSQVPAGLPGSGRGSKRDVEMPEVMTKWSNRRLGRTVRIHARAWPSGFVELLGRDI